MENKLITIITPTYNRANTLKRLYNSLKNQTFKNFRWLIMDDGSTDNTEDIVKELILNNDLEIVYHKHDNMQLFLTLYNSFKHVNTLYWMRVDSDDFLPNDSLEILYKNMLTIKHDSTIASVVGRVSYYNSNIKGDVFPTNPFIEFVFKMKYKYKISGVHAGLFKTDLTKFPEFNIDVYKSKGYIPNFLNIKTDATYKTKFINDFVYIYDLNEGDVKSLTNNKFKTNNAFGLSEYYRNFLKYYSKQYFFSYPIPVLKNVFKYVYYSSFIENQSTTMSMLMLSGFFQKFLFLIVYPMVLIFKFRNKGLIKI